GGAAAGAGAAAASEKPRLVAVTSCPTGIAHTYMAADALSQEAAERGVDLQVETQGSAGATALDPGVIAAADAVIFATDVGGRDRGRFAGKPVVEYGVKKGIDAPGQLISEALEAAADPDARRVAGSSGDSGDPGDTTSGSAGQDEHWARTLQRAVMTGVSYMVQFRSDRFAGKPVVEYGVKKGIDAPGQLISEALEAAADPDARRVAGSSGDSGDPGDTTSGSAGQDEHWARTLQRAVMTGVSYMVPF